jgi:4-alpha-glucanotransferase
MVKSYSVVQMLGELCGIEGEYYDNFGKLHRTTPEAAARILAAKGFTIAPSLLDLEPSVLVVASNDLPATMSLHFYYPVAEECRDFNYKIRLEEVEGRLSTQEFVSSDEQVRTAHNPQTGLLEVTIPFPVGIGEGSYTVRAALFIDGRTLLRTCLWLVCPPRAFMLPEGENGSRWSGIGIALYGLRSDTNWGVGDFRDLRAFMDWAAADCNVDFVGVNPLHAIFNRRPFNSSPYTPSSRIYRNFIYLDIPGIPEFAESSRAQALVASASCREQIRKLREDPQVQYEEVATLKLRVLRDIFDSFIERHGKERTSERWGAFAAYREAEGEYLERYAAFCALHERFARDLPEAGSWREWPEPYRDPGTPEVAEFRCEHEEAVLFWMYVQWQVEEQLRATQEHAIQSGMRIGLYCDEALGVDSDGADFWAWQEYFQPGFSVGAPPDGFAPEGQDWGFCPPNSEQIRNKGYEWFIRTLEASCKNCGALRIDHVMKLSHLFWIPAGLKAAAGVYVKDNEADLLNVLSLVSRQSQTIIVGEDLGTVPYDFSRRLMEKGLLSYRLFYFEREQDRRLKPSDVYPEAAMVSITTHDLPTLAGFWAGRDIEVRQRIGELDREQAEAARLERSEHRMYIVERLVQDGLLASHDGDAALNSVPVTDELHTAILRFLFRTRSRLVMINQEDVFLDPRQQNFPGTTWQCDNWVTKLKYTVEELRNDPEASRCAEKVKRLVRESGRAASIS